MNRLLAAIVLSGFALPALAVGTLVPAANRTDMVHDESRGLIYIANGAQVLRYDVASGTFASPIDLGGNLSGIDISPDNKKIVVAERNGSDTESWVYVVDLDSLASQRFAVATPDLYEYGTFTAVYGANGMIYTSSSASSYGNIRRLDPSTGSWTFVASVSKDTMLSASGDGQTIAFAENGTSGGPWGLIDIPTGTVIRRQDQGSTNHFNYEVATDRFGSQFSVLTGWNTFVYDDAYALLGNIGANQGPFPDGGAYHPVEEIAYFPWSDSSNVRVYDMNTRTQIGTYNFEYVFGSNGVRAFQFGRTRLSRDGSLLMVTVGGGVRILQLYAPLQASPVAAVVNQWQANSIGLAGSVGNNGSLDYSVAGAPAHGSVSVSGSTATYTPTPGYVGSDTFTYRVRYGRAERTATASLTVVDPNRAPVAVNDSAQTRNTAISIPVLANDSDPDGNAISLVSLTAPTAGTATIQGTKVLFTPPKSWPKTAVVFSYTISDVHGKTASAQVSVTRN